MRKFTPGYKHWKSVRQRCNNKNASNYKYYGAKGIKTEITLEEINELYERDNAKEMKQAHLSRKDHNKNYTFENCFFSDKKKNVSERNSRILSKSVEMWHPVGTFIMEFPSIKEAANYIGRDVCSITDALKGRSRTCAGYNWRYSNV